MVLNFSLSIPVNRVRLFDKLAKLIKAKPDWFNYVLKFTSFEPNFPFIYLQGTLCTNQKSAFLLKPDYININQSTIVPLRLDLSNLNITEQDYYDNILLNLLEIFNNSNNEIVISDLDFLNFLRDKFPNYNYSLSQNIYYYLEYTPSILNDIIKHENFYKVKLPISLNNNWKFLYEIKKQSILELPIITLPVCDNLKSCLLLEHYLIYNFSKNSKFQICTKCNTYKNIDIIKVTDNFNKNIESGFNNFYFPPILNDKEELDYFFVFFKNLFVKKDFWTNFEAFIIEEERLND